MRNFNMIKEIENEGQAIHQLEKGCGYTSVPWQWPHITDTYIFQKQEHFSWYRLVAEKQRGRFQLGLKPEVREKIY